MRQCTVRVFPCETHSTPPEAADEHEEHLLYVLTLVEGTWFRAALFPVVRLSVLSGRLADAERIYREAAAELLRLVDAPQRWIGSLTTFLKERAVPLAADAETFAGFVRGKENEVAKAVSEARYDREAFDLCSGRVLPVAAMQPRASVYAAAVANAGDLSLETRFTHRLHAERSATSSNQQELISFLAGVHEERFRIVGLGSVGLDFYVELESTIRNWFALFGRISWDAEREDRFAIDLSADLRLQDSAAALLARLRDLRAEFEAERG